MLNAVTFALIVSLAIFLTKVDTPIDWTIVISTISAVVVLVVLSEIIELFKGNRNE